MSATVVWLHYMVLVVPVAIALMRWRATAVVAVLALIMIAEEPFEMLIGKPAAPIESWLITPALVGLFGCAVWKLAEDRRRPAGDGGETLPSQPARTPAILYRDPNPAAR
jgi:hypothetical protein